MIGRRQGENCEHQHCKGYGFCANAADMQTTSLSPEGALHLLMMPGE